MAMLETHKYPVMGRSELQIFREQIKSVAINCSRAGLIGGAALRTHLDRAGMPVPRQDSGDIDLVVNDYGLPEAGIHRYGATVLDVFNTWAPFEPPFFETVAYQGMQLKLATVEHLLAKKVELSEGAEKDELYLAILASLVNLESVTRYIAGLKSKVPSYIKLDEDSIATILELAA